MLQRLRMLGGSVAFVAAKSVLRKLFAYLAHQRIASFLRKNRRRGDRRGKAVAFHNRALRSRQVDCRIAINEQEICCNAERLDCALHRQKSGLADVEAINFFHRCFGNRPCYAGS